MTSEVTCSGCRQTVGWPTGHSVGTDVDWLDPDGKARRVTMTDLTSERVFHACAPLVRVDVRSHVVDRLVDPEPPYDTQFAYLDRRGD